MNARKTDQDEVKVEETEMWWCDCCEYYHFDKEPKHKKAHLYLCPSCDEAFKDRTEAIECCSYRRSRNRSPWECGECGEGWDTRALAEACCVADDEENEKEPEVITVQEFVSPDPLDDLLERVAE